MAYNSGLVTTIAAQNTFTEWVRVSAKQGKPNNFTVAMANTASFTGTWTVQARRRLNDGATTGTVIDIRQDSVAGAYTAQLVGNWDIRVGVKTGDYTSGSAEFSIDWA